MMQRPLFGPRVPSRDERLAAYGEALMRQSAEGGPAGPAEAIARALGGGLGGYFAGQADKRIEAKEQEKQRVLAEALGYGRGWTNPDDGKVMGADTGRMISTLAANPDLAPLAVQLQMDDVRFLRDRAAKTEDRKADQDFTLQRDAAQQAFTKAENDLNRAAQVAQSDKSIAAQQALQAAQQAFTAAQNDMNRVLQRETNAAARVPTGYQATPEGGLAAIPGGPADPTRPKPLEIPAGYRARADGQGIEPIPGSKDDREQKSDAANKDEAFSATGRLIRSTDELLKHPGRESATGFSSIFPTLPGTEKANFEARLETMKAQSFLPMVQQLRGLGALSNAEGEKLTAAIGALRTNMGEKEFVKSLNEIRGDLMSALRRGGYELRDGYEIARVGAPAAATPIAPRDPSAPRPALRFLGYEDDKKEGK